MVVKHKRCLRIPCIIVSCAASFFFAGILFNIPHGKRIVTRLTTTYHDEPSLQQLVSLERFLIKGGALDVTSLGSCPATLQWLRKAEGWCKHVEELHACSDRLQRAQAENCAIGKQDAAEAAMRRLGDRIKASVGAISRSDDVGSGLRCKQGVEDIVCTVAPSSSRCGLETVDEGQPHQFALCKSLLPTEGCIFYAYGASPNPAFGEHFHCNGFVFDLGLSSSASFRGRCALFKLAAPMPDVEPCQSHNCSASTLETASPPVVQKLSSHSRVSLMKLDCNGCEYQLAREIRAKGPHFLASVDQLAIEVHLDLASPKRAESLALLFLLLEESGLHLAHVRIHRCVRQELPACPESLKRLGFFCDDALDRCLGLLFARVGTHELPHGAPDETPAGVVRSVKEQSKVRSQTISEGPREKLFAERCETGVGASGERTQLVWTMQEQAELCGGCMILGNYFASNTEWQRISGYGSAESEGVTGKYTDCAKTQTCTPLGVSMKSMEMYYDSVKKSSCCCTLLHDGAFDEKFVKKYQTERVRFMRVDPMSLNTIFNRKFGLNDARYFGIHTAFCAHTGWQKVFFSDIFDVKIGMSPCTDAQNGVLYIGTDNAAFQSTWLQRRFRELGTKYLDFFNTHLWQDNKRPMWSAGIIGAGDRQTMADFLAKLLAVLTDPEIEAVKRGDYQGVNMAAVTYVAERYFSGRTHGGAPLNSKYRAYERHRHDVWFIHK